nr:membrane steroid-binding protein 1-like [Ipomoea trifida]
MALQLWEALKEAITTYTGLSPATFFTIAALVLAIYYVVSGMFGSSDHSNYQRPREMEEEMQPLPPPVQVGEISEAELKQYDGSDPKKPLLMAIKGQIYDVSQSRIFYGPGGPYALFAGKDASRALAKMSFEEKDLTGDVSGLGPFELEALQDWEYKFMSKYVKVGTVKKAVAESEGTANGEPSEATEQEVKQADVSPENAKLAEDGPSKTVNPVEHTPPETISTEGVSDGNTDKKD